MTRNVARMRRKLTRRGRKALHSAHVLDEVVDSEVRLVPGLAGDARRRAVDHLAELVLLSQAYRHYSYGWISRRELERRGKGALGRLESLSASGLEQLTERE
ncbi:hypothetical protein ACL03H_02415 [Saccharopolyspora sp. MS10]|uniref:hypothetical protein n=1 Tax=Saccharopolyspora sp. MS10 TaxID=3385973 RepID=UPI0039A2003F